MRTARTDARSRAGAGAGRGARAGPAAAGWRRGGGFTLIELLVVAAVIGLALALVVPALENLTPGTALEADARRLASAIDLQQGSAIGQGQHMGIIYDLDNGTYQLFSPDPDNPRELKADAGPVVLSRYVKMRGIQPQGLRYQSGGELRVRFDPSSVGGSHILHLENTRGQVYSVKFNAIIGQAFVFQGEVGFEEARP